MVERSRNVGPLACMGCATTKVQSWKDPAGVPPLHSLVVIARIAPEMDAGYAGQLSRHLADGLSDRGIPRALVASGTYFYALQVDGRVVDSQKSLVLL